jgi:flavin-dependent dehydrogenase
MIITRNLTVKHDVDVFVAGGGPAGVAAAYTAAKNGVKVVLVEQCGDVGGISISGLMSHWTGSCGSPLYYEILQKSAKKNEGEHYNVITKYIDPEKLKTLYLEMLLEVGVEILLYTFACDAIMDGNQVKGVQVVNKSGFIDIHAQVVIDGTGDGDIAYKSGAEYYKGREEDEKQNYIDGNVVNVDNCITDNNIEYEAPLFNPSFDFKLNKGVGDNDGKF